MDNDKGRGVAMNSTLVQEAGVPTRTRATRLAVQAIPLLAILLLGIQLRLTFYQGIIHTDDLTYSHLAERMAEGTSPFAKPLPDAYGAVRIGLYAPVALTYKLFGVTAATTVAWPFALSLLSIIGAYAVGRLVHNEASGLLAAFVIAVLPTNVAAGTALLGDGPIATLSIATVFFLMVSSRTQGWKSTAAMAGSLGCFVLGVFNKPLILLLLPFLAVYMAVRVKRVSIRIAGTALAIAGIAGYALYFGSAEQKARPDLVETMQRLAATATDLWQLVLRQREFAWIAPLWIVAVVAVLAWRRSEAKVILSWLGLTFLYGELGTRTMTTYTPIVWYDNDTPARHMLLIVTPLAILTGVYLAEGVRSAWARWMVACAATVTGVVAWFGIQGAQNMTWGITGEGLSDLPFATISGVATVVVVFGGLASPVIVRAKSAVVRGIGTAAIILAVGLAALTHSYAAANEFKGPWIETLPQAVKFLETQPPLPILVQNGQFAQRLDYMSGYRLGFASSLRPFISNPRIQIAPADPDSITEAYVLIDDYYLRTYRDFMATRPGEPLALAYFSTPPARFSQIADLGTRPGNHIRIYRVSRSSTASELEAARAAVANNRTPSSLRALLNAATGAGAYCEAVRAWFDLREAAPQEISSVNAVPILTECYKANPDVAGPNIFLNGDFAQGLTAWSKHPESDATLTVEAESDAVPVWHASYRKGNWSTIYQAQALKPDTPYVYEATIRSTVPVIALYWQMDIGRHLGEGEYRTWTSLKNIFVTPHWEGAVHTGDFNPVLMLVSGEVWIKGLRLSELKRPPS